MLGDDVAPDVVRPGEDDAADAVAHVAFEPGLLDVAGGAEDAHCIENVLEGGSQAWRLAIEAATVAASPRAWRSAKP